MSRDLFSLEGRNAIVTGAAQGLGYAMAEGFLEYGANVILMDVNEKVFDTVEKLKAKGLTSVHGVQTDLTSRQDLAAGFDKCMEIFGGKLDILVNNAGVQYRCPILEFPMEKWDMLIELMLTAVFQLSRLAVGVMQPNHYGRIINICSTASTTVPVHNTPAYQAAKAAVYELTKTFASEFGKDGITTNGLAPGWHATEITKAHMNNPEVYNAQIAKIPLGKYGDPEDMKGPAIMLASEAGSYINGDIIFVDGGYVTR